MLLDELWNILCKFSKQIATTSIYIAETYSKPCQTCKMNLFAEIIDADTKANSKHCQTSEIEFFTQIVTGYRSEFRMYLNI